MTQINRFSVAYFFSDCHLNISASNFTINFKDLFSFFFTYIK